MTIKKLNKTLNLESHIHFLIYSSLILIILYYKRLILEIDYLKLLKKISILR